LTASNGICVLHDTINLTTFPTPTSVFTPVNQACSSDTITVQYTGNGNNVAVYNWNFSGATIISGNGAGPYQLNYPTPGTYPLTLAVNYPGCPSTSSNDTITITAGPIADFTIPDSICAGTSVNIIDNSVNTTAAPYTWNFGGGAVLSGAGSGPYTIQFNSIGIDSVRLSLGSGSCTSSLSKNIIVKPIPVASVIGPISMCSNDTLLITFNGIANSSATYSWDLGNATALNNPVIQTAQLISSNIGKDTIRLIVNDRGCVDTTTHIFTVYQQPIASFLIPDSICAGDSLTIISTSTISPSNANYSWTVTGGSPANFSNVSTITSSLSSIGNHFATLTINNNGCTDQHVDSIFVNPLPIVQFSATNSCEGLPITLQNQSSISNGNIFSQVWNFGDNQTSNLFDPLAHNYATDGTFMIKLTATSNHLCSAVDSLPIIIYDKPEAGFIADSVCLGKLTYLSDTSFVKNDFISSSVFTYNNSIISNNSTFSYPFNTVGSLPVQLITTSSHGCKDTLIKPVIIHSNPVISFTGGPLQGCEPLFVNFSEVITNNNGSITNVTYLFGDGDSANYTSPLHIYTVPGLYNVSLSATSLYGCTTDTTYTNYISVFENPIADFYYTPNNPDIFLPNINFVNTSLNGNQYNWTFGDSTSSNDINPYHSYNAAGTYPIELIVTTNNGCVDTTFGEVIIKPSYTIYIPNAFSPNNDDKNEIFQCKATNITNFAMTIYSRWGNYVTTINNLEEGWDGKENGKIVQEDTYIYQVSFTDVFNEEHQITGRVSVVK
jgi:gliding motility-associated-like protein